MKKYTRLKTYENFEPKEEWEDEISSTIKKSKIHGSQYQGNDNDRDNILNHWNNIFRDTCLEGFPEKFIKYFPNKWNYNQWEENMYRNNFDDEFEFYPEYEVDNIKDEFDIVIDDEAKEPFIDKQGYCHIPLNDWVDFFNDMWRWEIIK